jgi:hypothetical protein
MPSRYAEILIKKAARAVSVILLAGVVGLGAGTSAHAVQVNDFTGPYDVSNWTSVIPPGGMIDTSGAPNSIVITESTEPSAATEFFITAVAPGTFSFDWSVASNADGATLDIFVGASSASVSCTGTSCSAASNAGGSIALFGGFGSFSFSVNAGDKIGWSALNTDDGGPAEWTISNFSAPVPVPPALLLFVSALVTLFGVGRVRRQRAADTA